MTNVLNKGSLNRCHHWASEFAVAVVAFALTGDAVVDQVVGMATSGTPCALGDQDVQPLSAKASAMVNGRTRRELLRDFGETDFGETINLCGSRLG